MASSAARGEAHPLRPYYTPSDDNAAFVATTAPRYSANTSSSTNAATQRSTTSGSLSLPPASNRYSSSVDDVGGEAGSSYASTLSDAGMALLHSTALQYTSTCLAMPFEVGKLLLQVQWVPKDEVWMAFGEAEKDDEMKELIAGRQKAARNTSPPIGRNGWLEGEQGREGGLSRSDHEEWQDGVDDDEGDVSPGKADFGGEKDELSDEDEAEAYFRDLSNTSSRPLDLSRDSGRKRRKQTDSYGYVVRRSIHEDVTRPEFVMPIVVRGGVWEMIKAVGRGKEGWLGLWKGTFTTFVLDVSTLTIQPIISSILALMAPSALTSLPLPYAPHPYRSLTLLLASHLCTGIILSPLDLVRTRLIAQSTLPAHRKYTSPWNALSQISKEEGGWKTTFLHPNLLIPTLLDYTFRPLLSLSAPLLIEHTLRLDPLTSPVSYSLAEFCISSASLIITLPIETVRRRLQLQARAPWGGKKAAKVHQSRSSVASTTSGPTGSVQKPMFGRPLRTCVETRPKPYEGVLEAIWRIVTEETSSTPVKKNASSAKSSSSSSSQQQSSSAPAHMQDSGILAKPGHSSLGGVHSLYRGLGFAIGANALVFVLTIVTGERASSTAGWAEI